jgi:SAM-dependent methyltransferase
VQDRFTQLAGEYARYRPGYPPELAEYLASLTGYHEFAWDCATGNGQAAVLLAPHFQQVLATDISPGQVSRARPKENIVYSLSRAEQTPVSGETVDLITVAQAIHWFDFDAFYTEVDRVLKPGGILCAWGYDQPEIEPAVDRLCAHYFNDLLGPYLPNRMAIVMEHYQTLPFPFHEITPPDFAMQTQWALDHLVGMLSSMSPVSDYEKDHGSHPMEAIYDALEQAWGHADTSRPVHWHLFFKMGRKGDQ